MKKPTCETCDYWDEKSGQCRKNPPRLPYQDTLVWTYVTRDEWCGEHSEFKDWQESKKLAKKKQTTIDLIKASTDKALNHTGKELGIRRDRDETDDDYKNRQLNYLREK